MIRCRTLAAIAGSCLTCGTLLAVPAALIPDAQVARADDAPAGDQNPHSTRQVPHAHPAVEVAGDPILTRLTVRVREPRRMLVDKEGRVLIADSAAGKVWRVDSTGSSATLAEDLDEPAGLALDSKGNLYVALRAGDRPRAGSIIRIDAAGKTAALVRGLSGPAALAIDHEDALYAANAGDETVLRIEPDGRSSLRARSIAAPTALWFHRGALYVASAANGSVARLDSAGRETVLADGFMAVTDLATGPDGELIVCDEGASALAALHPDGTRVPYLSVPAGTRTIAFDGEGNLVAASAQLRLVVRLTTRLHVPCPHCDQRIPLRIRPRKPLADEAAGPI